MDAGFLLKLTAHGVGNEIQGVFVLWAVGNGIHGAFGSPRKLFQATLEKNDQLAFPGGWWAIEQEDTTPDIGAERGSFKIFHHFGQGLIDAEQIVFKKGIVLLASLIHAQPRS